MATDALLRVPTELWCYIWNFLPMEAVVAASQTCSGWRTAALNCPALWREVAYVSSLRYDGCPCRKCSFEGFSNLPHMHEILRRSEVLPISVTVTILHKLWDHDELEQFAELLRPELHRVRTLRIRTLDSDFPSWFLAKFDILPSLRALYVGADVDSRLTNSIFNPTHPLALPALEVLEVRGSFFMHNEPPPWLSFPTLTRLVIGFGASFELLGYLESCPHMEYLQLRMADRGLIYEYPSDHERIRAVIRRMPRCRTIEVVGIDLDDEDIVLNLFDNARTPRLALSYKGSVGARATGFRILGAVAQPTAVRLVLDARSDGEYVVASVTDGTLERSVAFRRSPDVSSIWAHIQLGDVPELALEIDVRLWRTGSLDAGLLRAARSLTLSFPRGESGIDFHHTPVPAHPMTSLERLHIAAVTVRERVPVSHTLDELRASWIARRRLSPAIGALPEPVRLPAGYLRRLVQSFNPPHRLETIAVDDYVELEGDAESEVAAFARAFVRCASNAQARTWG